MTGGLHGRRTLDALALRLILGVDPDLAQLFAAAKTIIGKDPEKLGELQAVILESGFKVSTATLREVLASL